METATPLVRSRRLPKRGEWVMLNDGSDTIAEMCAKHSGNVYVTLWLKQKRGAREFPHQTIKTGGVYDFCILPPATHRFTFSRNIYFHGFSADEMEREVIWLSTPMDGKDGVVVVIDLKTMRKDAILRADVIKIEAIEESTAHE